MPLHLAHWTRELKPVLSSGNDRAQLQRKSQFNALVQSLCPYRYYDLGPSDLCGRTPGNEGAPFPANWSNATGMNTSPTKCEFKMSGGIGPTLGQLGTNRIVGE